jgi:hypothetical protein
MTVRRWLVLALAAGLVSGTIGIALASGGAHGTPNPNSEGHGNEHSGGANGQGVTPVLICHATHSADNPMVAIVTDDDALIGHHEQHPDDVIITTGVPAANDQATQNAMCGIASVTDPGTDPSLPTPPPLTG